MSSALSIPSVIAAAGFSRRMGDFKQLLPWGEGTVIEAVVKTLERAGSGPVVVVVGHRGGEVAQALARTPAQIVPNPELAAEEMIRSYQWGIRHLLAQETELSFSGALLALGDQPHIPVDVIGQLLAKASEQPAQIVIPSFQMRRGHPIYLPRILWQSLLDLGLEESLRNLLRAEEERIVYVPVETDAIRRDMDFPEEYETLREEFGQQSLNR